MMRALRGLPGSFSHCTILAVITLIVTTNISASLVTQNSISLSDGQPFRVTIKVGQLPTSFVYDDYQPTTQEDQQVLFQAHAQWHFLSVTEPPPSERHTVGTDVGLLSTMTSSQTRLEWLVTAVQSSQPPVTFDIVVVAYRFTRFNCTEMSVCDPVINLTYANQLHHIQFNGSRDDGAIYDVYQHFLGENDHRSAEYIKQLMNILDRTRLTSVHPVTRLTHKRKTLKFAAYRGQGVVYSVIRHTADGSHGSMYVPAVSYSCNYTTLDNCTDTADVETKIIVVILGICGLVVCFVGHRIFNFEMFFFGFLCGQFIAYLCAIRLTTWVASVKLWASVGGGFIGGLIWMLQWMLFGCPTPSMTVVAVELGFMVACIVFNLILQLVSVDWMLADAVYLSVFLATTGMVALFTMLASRRAVSLLGCSLIGSYLAVFAIDWFTRSSIKHLVLNAISKFTIHEFRTAYITIPFQITDMCLVTAWLMLAIVGLVFQCYRERDRPQFPECCRHKAMASAHKRRLDEAALSGAYYENLVHDELAPLLQAQRLLEHRRQVERMRHNVDQAVGYVVFVANT